MNVKSSYSIIILFLSLVTSPVFLSNNTIPEPVAANLPLPSNMVLIPFAFENETFINHKMMVDIHRDYSIKITSTFVLVSNNSQPIDFFILIFNRTITSVFCYDPIGLLEFTWFVGPPYGNVINITMRYPLLPGEVYVFSTTYEIENIVYFVQGRVDYYGLDYEVIHPRYSLSFILEVNLPVYAKLLDENPPEPVFPKPTKIYEENEIITINWQLSERNTEEIDVFLLRFVSKSSQNPEGALLKAFFFLLTLLGGIAIGFIPAFLFHRFRKKPAEKELVTSLLTDTEQEVIKAINADGGVSTQRRICDRTGYSKSKVSQILAKLEEKKVLKRERWGRTNKVTISNQTFKQLGTIDPKEKTLEY